VIPDRQIHFVFLVFDIVIMDSVLWLITFWATLYKMEPLTGTK